MLIHHKAQRLENNQILAQGSEKLMQAMIKYQLVARVL